jgi:hypothetical protein
MHHEVTGSANRSAIPARCRLPGALRTPAAMPEHDGGGLDESLRSIERFAKDRNMPVAIAPPTPKRRGRIPQRGVLPHSCQKSARSAQVDLGFCKLPENAIREQRRKQPREHRGLRLTIVDAAPYVGRMTEAANEGRRQACQGLHNGPVLAYVSSRTVRLTVASHSRDRFFLRFAAPPGG